MSCRSYTVGCATFPKFQSPSYIEQRTEIRTIDTNNKQAAKVDGQEFRGDGWIVVGDNGNIKNEGKVAGILLHELGRYLGI